MSAWIRITITASERDQEVLVAELTAVGLEGFVQESDRLEAYASVGRWTRRLEASIESICRRASRRTRRRVAVAAVERLRDQNWNAMWERSAGIVEATPRIVIKPSWKLLRKRDRGKIVLHIDPKMSFGTGHHETTRICLGALERSVEKGASVLDVGTGTGVLAIAAVKLGAKRAVGLDNDPWCFDNARENIVRNRVRDRVRIILGGVEKIPDRRYDLVVANIDLPTITRTLRRIVRAVRPAGTLVLSGLLVTDIPAISRLLMKHPSLQPTDLVAEGEWVGVVMKKDERR
ncbi:MAG: 50S ribosomal protein L11 methyltransferase [Bacteroidetes bacterium]|jgi:ribosomal protein L11 methyltransferase|nr:50S ribosomal protein L11 methyltransferase [Bacteroidota bacterium]